MLRWACGEVESRCAGQVGYMDDGSLHLHRHLDGAGGAKEDLATTVGGVDGIKL